MPENTIAFQGVPGAYADLACHSVFPAMKTLSCTSFEDCFAAVRDKRAKLAMIPVENSIAGRVADIHHLLPEGGLYIVGEHYQRVLHHLLALPGTKVEDIKTVQSHTQALAQCRKYIADHGFTPISHGDTAGGAKDVALKGDKTIAGIASSLAGEIYGLQSLDKDIADQPNNTTRFLVLSREPASPAVGTHTITSLLFKIRSTPAALYKALGGFATCGVNLTKIESYLVGGKFDAAQFFVDVEGHPDELPMKMALEELAFYATDIKLFGSYAAHPFRRS